MIINRETINKTKQKKNQTFEEKILITLSTRLSTISADVYEYSSKVRNICSFG